MEIELALMDALTRSSSQPEAEADFTLRGAEADGRSDTRPLSSSPTAKLATQSAATAFAVSGALPRGRSFFSSCGCAYIK
jgi:hypothetical protein